MDEMVRSGIVRIAEESFPATVRLRIIRNPHSPVGEQQVDVEFHGEEPASYKLVIARELTFRENAGKNYELQYSGTSWTMKNPKVFLE